MFHRRAAARGIALCVIAIFCSIAVCAQDLAKATGASSIGPSRIQAIAFARGRGTVLGDTRLEIFVDDRHSKKPRSLTEGVDPDWSPDGAHIIFADTSGNGPRTDVFIINADGSNRKQLTRMEADNDAATPSWSPDGRKIAFTMASRSNKPSQIYLVDPDGTNLRIVTNGFMPRWSPDGRRLIFVRGSKHNRSSIWVTNTDGSGAQQIVDDSSMSGFPRWSPDGARIVFSSDRDGHSAIYSANPDGSKVQRLIYSKDLDFFSPILSPDGSHMVVFAGKLFDAGGRSMMRVDEPISILVIALDSTHETDVLDQGAAPSVLWTRN